MTSLYKYGGTQTIASEIAEYKARAEHAEKLNRQLVAERMAISEQYRRQRSLTQAANAWAGKLERKIETLNETIKNLRKDKQYLQSRIVGLKKVRPYKVYEEPKPINDVADINDFSGPRGLLAAVEEAKILRRTRNAA